MALGHTQRVERGIDHADVGAAGLVLEWTAVAAWNAHHVAERREDGPMLDGQGQPLVDAPHGEHTYRTPGAVNQLDV
jgi:hypothetical protein